MTRLTDAQYLELAVQCLEHARQSTAIRDCQCHACKGFMQQSGELIEDIKKRSALETGACRCKREDGSTRFNINCTIHGKAP